MNGFVMGLLLVVTLGAFAYSARRRLYKFYLATLSCRTYQRIVLIALRICHTPMTRPRRLGLCRRRMSRWRAVFYSSNYLK